MKLTERQIEFIEEHSQADTARLLLDASRYPEMDVPFAVEQIAARRQIRDKLPGWYANKALVFPSKLAAEQCSSELTASYKQQLVDADNHVCDLTGGLGVDSYYYALKARRVTYIERFNPYAEAAENNYRTLGVTNITVINGNGEELATKVEDVDVFYLDPARRGGGNKRVFALPDCEPDLTALYPILLQHAPKVIAKISPMADIAHTLNLLPETTEVHVVSVRNECKELLFVMEREGRECAPRLMCINLLSDGVVEQFAFTAEEEKHTVAAFAAGIGRYIYEPNVSLLKAGAFKVITERYAVKKVHVSSHIYTSEALVEGFPGRVFRVDEVMAFTSALCKRIAKELPQANITVRNFPLTVDVLRRKTRINDGGKVYLFATTLAGGDKVLLRTHKVK